jgi:hypothetical protein
MAESVNDAVSLHAPDKTPDDKKTSFLTPKDGSHDEISRSVSSSPSSDRTDGFPWRKRIGPLAIITLTLGTAVILAAVAALSFLWFAPHSNRAWRAVAARNWLPRAVVLLSEALKLAVGCQVGACAAMLASLSLERFEARLPDAACVSACRTSVVGGGTILTLAWTQLRGFGPLRLRRTVLPCLMMLIAIVYALAQVVSVLLVGDIVLGPLPGRAATSATAYGMSYSNNSHSFFANVPSVNSTQASASSTWLREPLAYPAFAEYSEAPYTADGVSDTGLTLRAFLPLAVASDRENVQQYSGKTTVLDARVTCQPPQLAGEVVQYVDTNLVLNGTFLPSRSTPRMGNFTLGVSSIQNASDAIIAGRAYNAPVPFSCLAPAQNDRSNGTQWKTSLCQLPEFGSGEVFVSGGLVSEFRSLSSSPTANSSIDVLDNSSLYGTAYLILNYTLGDPSDWLAVTQTAAAPPAYSERGEWIDLVYSDGSLVLSVSLCYSAFDTADIPVYISSAENRTEPGPTFDLNKGQFHFDAIRKQLGQSGPNDTLADRGVLSLQSQRNSWLATDGEQAPVEPVLRGYADLQGFSPQGNSGNISAVLWETYECTSLNLDTISSGRIPLVCPNLKHVWLFQEIIQSGGSVAFALQSLITSLVGIEYYSVLPQFDKVEAVQQTYFVLTNVAKHRAGFTVVTVTIALHLFLVGVVAALFLRQSRYSMLGNTWQAVAQVTTGDTREFVDGALTMSDGEVKYLMAQRGDDRKRVGLALVPGTDMPGLVEFVR